MAYAFSTLSVSAPTHDGVATVTLANGRGNAMSQLFFAECRQCFTRIAQVSIRGGGGRVVQQCNIIQYQWHHLYAL
jgi:hypothetical protein